MRALAEAPRLLMHYTELDYDYIMSWDYYDKDWSEAKPLVPFRQLPMLVVDKKHEICQSISILTFIENITGTNITDPDTKEKVEHCVDLTTLKHKEVDSKLMENGNKFEFELPNSKRVIEFKLLTHKDEKDFNEEMKSYEKAEELTGISMNLTTRLKYQIVSIDGDTNKKTINNFIDNEFLALDSRAFRAHYDKVNPDIELKFDYTSQTGNVHKVDVPLGTEFFWPAARE